MIDKKALLILIVQKVEEEILRMESTLGLVHSAINDAPGAMQSHSDTTRFQSSNVANEQTASLFARREALRTIYFFMSTMTMGKDEKIGHGSVVEIVDGDAVLHYFVLPDGGGEEVVLDGCLYIVTTPKAPLIQQLIGKGAGATAFVGLGSRSRLVEVKSVE